MRLHELIVGFSAFLTPLLLQGDDDGLNAVPNRSLVYLWFVCCTFRFGCSPAPSVTNATFGGSTLSRGMSTWRRCACFDGRTVSVMIQPTLQALLITVIVTTYATLNPLMIPFGMIYYGWHSFVLVVVFSRHSQAGVCCRTVPDCARILLQ
jgi:hypothetical protein